MTAHTRSKGKAKVVVSTGNSNVKSPDPREEKEKINEGQYNSFVRKVGDNNTRVGRQPVCLSR